jgi:hypothetical protein
MTDLAPENLQQRKERASCYHEKRPVALHWAVSGENAIKSPL